MLTSIPGSIGLHLLRQQSPLGARAAGVDSAELVLRAATGAPGLLFAGPGELAARGKVTEALFDLGRPDPVAMKVRLMERLGEKFGLEMDSFPSRQAYGRAIKTIVDGLKRSDLTAFIEIEKELGLRELGLSLDTLVDAIVEPGGSADEAVDAALQAKLGNEGGGGNAPRNPADQAQPDDIGLYGSRR